jgi:lactate dehydrogenase-like 2-hydroxyacid dehydrogenase
MAALKPVAIALFPLPAYLRQELRQRFSLCEFGELGEAEAERWLEMEGPSVCAVVTNGKLGCGRAILDSLPNLQIIVIFGVGFDKVDLPAARARGVVVANTPDVLTDDVADLAVGLVISLLRGIARADRFVRKGRWLTSEFPLMTKVTGSRFGIVGLGRIGTAIAERLNLFGPVAYTGTGRKPVEWEFHENLVSLARWSDVLIVATAASEQTRGLVGAEVLSALGADAYLVNVARGSILDQRALIDALDAGRLAGAALDVFEDEPNVPEKLRSCDRLLLTPHIGSATVATRRGMADALLANVDCFLAGRPVPHQV